VVEGYVTRNAKVRVLRDNVVIFDGNLDSLKRFKDDVKEVREGYECGIGIKDYNDVKLGDILECYEARETARTLD
jgi:translation initiation factor IF-2